MTLEALAAAMLRFERATRLLRAEQYVTIDRIEDLAKALRCTPQEIESRARLRGYRILGNGRKKALLRAHAADIAEEFATLTPAERSRRRANCRSKYAPDHISVDPSLPPFSVLGAPPPSQTPDEQRKEVSCRKSSRKAKVSEK